MLPTSLRGTSNDCIAVDRNHPTRVAAGKPHLVEMMKKDDLMIWRSATICAWLAGFFAVVFVLGLLADVAPSEHSQRDTLCFLLTVGALTVVFLLLTLRARKSAKMKETCLKNAPPSSLLP